MYVYLIFDPFSRLTKIGKSKNPKVRLKQARIFNPKCELLFISMEHNESILHEKFIDKKINGEWFSLNKDDLFSITNSYKCIPKTLYYTNTKKDLLRKTINERLIDSQLEFIYSFKEYPHIKVSKCRKIFNSKTGKRLKITINGGSIGVWVAPKVFIVKSKINNHIVLIPKKIHYPF